jgi:RNA polymerase-associated protein
MPVDPVSRAGLRKVHYRVLRDWYPLWREFEAASGKKAGTLGKQLQEGVAAANELFQRAEFVLSEELTLVDCTLAPLFWRMQAHSLLPSKGAPDVLRYAERLFKRASFNASLTSAERELIRSAA